MATHSAFDYAQAFCRNLGLLTPDDQARLRQTTIAIPGMGGVGGHHLLSLTRLGVGRFVIADGDVFDLPNMNRQAGATIQTLGQSKVAVMAAMALAINPELSLRTVPEALHQGNLDAFLSGCALVVDGLDFFQIRIRRVLFRRARELGLTVVTAGPLGFSAATLIFTPDSPSFDEFLGIHDGMPEQEQLIRFALALAPAGLHLPYLDRAALNIPERRGPSSVIAVELCAAIAATEILHLILKRRPPLVVPWYSQFDPHRRQYRIGKLPLGNRHPLQRLKLWYLRRWLERSER